MNVLLVNPSYAKKIYQKPFSVQPPIGLAYLAAYLEEKGIPTEILDANAMLLSVEEIVKQAVNSRASVIGLSSVTSTIYLTYEIAKGIKGFANKTIIVGGPHVSFTAKETLSECSSIDIVVRGEGEETLWEVLEKMEKGESVCGVRGISFRQDGKVVSTEERPQINPIDKIPFPAYHLLPIDLYRPSPLLQVNAKGKRYGRLVTSRGCPNRCTFCSSSHFWKGVRMRSPQNIVEEIQVLKDQYGVRHIDFLDDTFTLSRQRVFAVCDLLLNKGLYIKWSCSSRVDTIDEKLIKKMKDAGCFGICFGVESGDQEILDRVKKNIKIGQIRQAIRLSKKYGLKTMADFMIGLPGDTDETIEQTISFAKELNPDIAFFSLTTPFPGTELFFELKKAKKLPKRIDWDAYSLHGKTIAKTEALSSSEIVAYYNKAQKDFYLRASFFIQILWRIIRHPFELINYWRLLAFYLSGRLLGTVEEDEER